MTATPRYQLPDTFPAPSRSEVLQRVSEGSLAEVLWRDTDSAESPAHALQQRLLQAYMATPSRSPGDRLPLAARTGIIFGTAIALWIALAGMVALAIALF